jgi:sterol 3beta-glucosyltransferase
MRITILTIGTHGDVAPLIALGLGLQTRGYRVKLATHGCFQTLIESYGLSFFDVGADPRHLHQGGAVAELLESGDNPLQLARQYQQAALPLITQILDQFWIACADAEALIINPLAFCGYDIARTLNIPCFLAAFVPLSAHPDFPAPAMPATVSLGSFYNQLTYPLVRLLFWQLLRSPVNQWRSERLQLPPLPIWPDPFATMIAEGVPCLYACSPSVISRPSQWPASLQMTGYWFLDRPTDWVPPPALIDFLADGPLPVCVGFGSMRSRDPETLTKTIVAALQRVGCRGVLLTGWGGIKDTELPDTVLALEAVPHDWLFPRVSAVIHHGGAGTTASALRAGIPSVVIPFFADQSFWARRITQLGAGVSLLSTKQVDAQMLAAALNRILDDQVIGHCAAHLGNQIRVESGVSRAIEILHRNLSYHQEAVGS